MSGGGPQPDRVPTLTEVVQLDASQPQPVLLPLGAPAEADVMAAASSLPAPSLNEEQIVQRVLTDLQRQVDLMLEYRLRELLAPILTRAADAVIREARAELASTLRDVVTRAVTQELSRHRSR